MLRTFGLASMEVVAPSARLIWSSATTDEAVDCTYVIYSHIKNNWNYLVSCMQFTQKTIYTCINCRYLFGLYAFGLEETNFYREAEKQARKVRSKREQKRRMWGCCINI